MVHDMRCRIGHRGSLRHRPLQGAGAFADIRMKDLKATLPHRLVTGDSGNPFGGGIERSDAPACINREDTFVDGIEDNVSALCFTHYLKDTQSGGLCQEL